MSNVIFGDGDLIRLTNGEDIRQGRVRYNEFHMRHYLDGYNSSIELNLESGWELSVIEKAKPKLPTEPGSVVKFKHQFIVFQLRDGIWQGVGILTEHSPAALLDRFGHDFEVYEAKK